MTLEFKVDGQSLSRLDLETVAANARNFITCKFHISPEWFAVTPYTVLKAVFERDGKAYGVLLDDEMTCVLPYEAVDGCGCFDVSLTGVCADEEGTAIRATSNKVHVRVEESGALDTANSKPPTPEELEQLEIRLTELGTRITCLSSINAAHALCQAEDAEYHFIWTAPHAEFDGPGGLQLRTGGIYSIVRKGNSYTITLTADLKGKDGEDGEDGKDGASFIAVASASDITALQSVLKSGHYSSASVLALVTAAFGDYIQGDVLEVTVDTVTVKMNIGAPDAVNEEAVNTLIDAKLPKPSVKKYGAVGDGVADDTSAFATALAENRVLYVPGGTYKLSDTIVIGKNCELELAQDTVLKFTQTESNGIEMCSSATLRGNHAVISVPYEFTANVISIDSAFEGTSHVDIPPYKKADPLFKRQRFIYDVNIVKPTVDEVNSGNDGFNSSKDGTCNGTAIYMTADGNASIRCLWAIILSGIRIDGGFSYGIRAANFDKVGDYEDNAWNHDMRIEAVIEACEVGVALENCNGAHLQVTVQPNVAMDGSVYAKWGFYLNDSRFVDMIGSRVWDWNANTTLWTSGGEYQHIAMIGNCRGLLLDDFLCNEHGADIRDLIYTDTPGNFDTMTVLQEPANKWFKSVENKPYFNDGTADRKLMLASDKITAEQTDFISPADGYYTYEPNFINLVSAYDDGYFLDSNGNLSPIAGYVTTDYIPVNGELGQTYRIGGEGISWSDDWYYCRIAWYDSNKKIKGMTASWEKFGTSEYYPSIVEDDTVAFAFLTTALNAGPKDAAYFKLTAKGKGANLVITIDEKQDYTSIWHGEPKRLNDEIKIKAENVIGGSTAEIVDITMSDDGGSFYSDKTFQEIADGVRAGKQYSCRVSAGVAEFNIFQEFFMPLTFYLDADSEKMMVFSAIMAMELDQLQLIRVILTGDGEIGMDGTLIPTA